MSFWEGFEKQAEERSKIDEAAMLGGAVTGGLLAGHAASLAGKKLSPKLLFPLAALSSLGGSTVAGGTSRTLRNLFSGKKKDSYPTVRHEHELLGRI